MAHQPPRPPTRSPRTTSATSEAGAARRHRLAAADLGGRARRAETVGGHLDLAEHGAARHVVGGLQIGGKAAMAKCSTSRGATSPQTTSSASIGMSAAEAVNRP